MKAILALDPRVIVFDSAGKVEDSRPRLSSLIERRSRSCSFASVRPGVITDIRLHLVVLRRAWSRARWLV